MHLVLAGLAFLLCLIAGSNSRYQSSIIRGGVKMTMNQRNTIDLDQGWDLMQRGITKLKNILEGKPQPQFSSEDYMHRTIYNMCTQKPPQDYSKSKILQP